MKISILTSCFNNAKHLPDCINSVMSQNHPDLEWIIVDDHSEDNTPEILEGIKDDRVKVIRNSTRMFCSSAYNVALSNATGEICAILDGDDMLGDNAVHMIAKRYRRHPHIGYIYTQHQWCNAYMRNKRRGLSSMPPRGMSFVDMALTKQKHCFSHWRTFRTKLSEQAEIFPKGLKYAVDKNMGFVLEEIARGAFLDKRLYLYRYHKENMSLKNPKDQKRLWMRLAREHLAKRKSSNRKHFPVIRVD